MALTLTEAERAELAQWHVGRGSKRQTVPEWLASNPPHDRVRAMLVRLMDRTNGGVGSVLLGQVLARQIGVDADYVFAENFPRKAAKLAEQLRAQGDLRRSGWIRESLVEMMFCANCGRPLADPISIDRGIGPDCWPRIDPGWRAAIEQRLTTAAADRPKPEGALW